MIQFFGHQGFNQIDEIQAHLFGGVCFGCPQPCNLIVTVTFYLGLHLNE